MRNLKNNRIIHYDNTIATTVRNDLNHNSIQINNSSPLKKKLTIIFIVVGVILLVIAAAVCVYLFLFSKKKKITRLMKWNLSNL